MNENATKLIEELAHKLGTTSQYLWQVLIKHAKIDATTGLIQAIIVSLFGVVLYKIHKNMMRRDEQDYNGYYRYEGFGLTMIVAFIAFVIIYFRILCGITDIINGYFDPEYWALHEIISNIK